MRPNRIFIHLLVFWLVCVFRYKSIITGLLNLFIVFFLFWYHKKWIEMQQTRIQCCH